MRNLDQTARVRRRISRRGGFFRCAIMLLALLALVALDPPQQLAPWGATAHAGSAVVGGRRVSCQFGEVITKNDAPGLGFASYSQRKIWLNKKLLSRYPAAFQQFVFLHECAHMYTRSETDADCWAIKRGVYRKLFTKRSLEQICGGLWGTSGGLWHPPGPARCRNMARCFAQASGLGDSEPILSVVPTGSKAKNNRARRRKN